MRVEGCEMALMCQGVVSQLWNHLRNGGAAAKIGVFRRGGFRRAFRSCEMKGRLRNGTRVPKGCLSTAKNFVEEVHGAAKSFRNQGAISQRRPDFAAATWGLQNYFAAKGHFRRGPFWAAKFRRPWIFPCFWAPLDSQRSSFNFFAIPSELDHSKRLSYI